MTIEWSTSGDLAQTADGLVSVTVRRRGCDEVASVANAWRGPIGRAEAEQSGGRYLAADVIWRLPAGELAGEPRPGDVIIDQDRNRWTVLETRQSAADGTWRCASRNLAITAGLSERVIVEQGDAGKGAAGALVLRWHELLSGVAARLQPLGEELGVYRGARQSLRKFLATLGEEIEPCDSLLRLIDSAGNRYEVVAYRRAERIDELPQAEVVAVTDSD